MIERAATRSARGVIDTNPGAACQFASSSRLSPLCCGVRLPSGPNSATRYMRRGRVRHICGGRYGQTGSGSSRAVVSIASPAGVAAISLRGWRRQSRASAWCCSSCDCSRSRKMAEVRVMSSSSVAVASSVVTCARWGCWDSSRRARFADCVAPGVDVLCSLASGLPVVRGCPPVVHMARAGAWGAGGYSATDISNNCCLRSLLMGCFRATKLSRRNVLQRGHLPRPSGWTRHRTSCTISGARCRARPSRPEGWESTDGLIGASSGRWGGNGRAGGRHAIPDRLGLPWGLPPRLDGSTGARPSLEAWSLRLVSGLL